MIGTQIHFNDQVHGILELPDTLTALVNTIQSTFENKLPDHWTLYHTNSEGVSTAVSTEEQYKALVEAESAIPSSTSKFYIVPNEPQKDNVEEVPAQSSDLNKIVSDVAKKLGYLDIEDNNNDNVFQDQILMTNPDSQNNREQMAEANNNEALLSPQNEEVNPQAGPQPKDEERKNKKRLHKAKHIIKKLFYSRMPECKKAWLLEKLESIQRKLSPAQQEKLQRKKERVMMKSRKRHHKHSKDSKEEDGVFQEGGYHRGFHGRHGHHGYHDHHGHHGYHHGHHGRYGRHEHPEYDFENIRKVVLLSKQKIEEDTLGLTTVNSELPLVSTAQMETEARVDPEGKPVHSNVVCSGCGMAPIVGVRYRCSVCAYFDFCEKCEETKKHPHLFLKVREDEPKGIKVPISVGSQQEGNDTIKVLPAKNMVKAFKGVKKMIKAIKKGDIKKFNKCHEKLFKEYPDEAKRVLESAEDWYPEGQEGLRHEWKKLKHKRGGKVRDLGYWGRRRGGEDGWRRPDSMSSQEVERQYRFMNRSMADLHIGDRPSNR